MQPSPASSAPASHRLVRLPLLLLGGFALSLAAQTAPAPAAAPVADEAAVELPVFTVTSTEETNRYAPKDSLSAARIRAPLADTSASISVVTKEFLNDIGANSVLDGTRYFSGLGAGRGAGTGGILDRHVIRGFENDGVVLDNFATNYQANLDPQFVERLEVLKGPNNILAPTGTAGGSINSVTKSPKFKAEGFIQYQGGRFDAQKFTLDSTGPIPGTGDKLAYRLVLNHQDTGNFMQGNIEQDDIMAAFTWRINPRSQVTFKYFGIDWLQRGAVSAANTWGIALDPNLPAGSSLPNDPPPGFSRRGANGVTEWSERISRIDRYLAEYTTSIGDHLSVRLAGNWHEERFGQDQGLPGIPELNASRFNPFTGAATPNIVWARQTDGTFTQTPSLLWDATKIKRIDTVIQNKNRNRQVQLDIAGTWQVGPISVQPLIGGTYRRDHQPFNFNKTAALPDINLFAPDNDVPRADPSTFKFNQSTSRTDKTFTSYEFLRLSALDDRIFATGGIARVYLDNRTTNELNKRDSLLKDQKNTYQAGVLVKPIRDVSLYYNYSTNATGVQFNNAPIFRTGEQDEIGGKFRFFGDRLEFDVSYFDISLSNLTTPNPAFNTDPANNPPNLLSSQTNDGFEFELKGQLTDQLSIIASYTDMDLKDSVGRRPRNIANTTWAGLLNYGFSDGALKGLNVHFGVTHSGKTAGETTNGFTALGVAQQPGFWIKSFELYNVGASYSFGKYFVNATVDNLFDHQGFWQAAGRGAIPPIPGINPRVTFGYRF